MFPTLLSLRNKIWDFMPSCFSCNMRIICFGYNPIQRLPTTMKMLDFLRLSNLCLPCKQGVAIFINTIQCIHYIFQHLRILQNSCSSSPVHNLPWVAPIEALGSVISHSKFYSTCHTTSSTAVCVFEYIDSSLFVCSVGVGNFANSRTVE